MRHEMGLMGVMAKNKLPLNAFFLFVSKKVPEKFSLKVTFRKLISGQKLLRTGKISMFQSWINLVWKAFNCLTANSTAKMAVKNYATFVERSTLLTFTIEAFILVFLFSCLQHHNRALISSRITKKKANKLWQRKKRKENLNFSLFPFQVHYYAIDYVVWRAI